MISSKPCDESLLNLAPHLASYEKKRLTWPFFVVVTKILPKMAKSNLFSQTILIFLGFFFLF
tara:strand:- start:1840 stop:2025 length:186 start_codon:yes stop_codon:yes gene_type:complete